jgi:hypothetical protein
MSGYFDYLKSSYPLFYFFEYGEEFLHGLGAEHTDACLAEIINTLEER